MSYKLCRGLLAFSFLVLIALSCFPVIFDWSNRVQPWILDIPFSMFWQLLMMSSMCLLLVIWCIADELSGDLDVDIEHVQNENNGKR